MSLKALPYYGGKNYQRKWINELLGPNREYGYYSEPFFGMGSVLLGRPRAAIEVVTDTNSRVVNWWKVLQAQPDELAGLVSSTPHSRECFLEAIDQLDEGTSLERAAAFSCVIFQGRMAGDGISKHWASRESQAWLGPGFSDMMRRVAIRVRRLQIDNRPATHLLDRLKNKPHAIIYCDPPYWGKANVTAYKDNDPVDLTDLLLAQKGRCAVSGYGDQWDHLGWERHERDYRVQIQGQDRRTEVLWCNGK